MPRRLKVSPITVPLVNSRLKFPSQYGWITNWDWLELERVRLGLPKRCLVERGLTKALYPLMGEAAGQ